MADNLYNQKKISKIVKNRVNHIWSFFPHGNPIIPTKRFNKLFDAKEIDIQFMRNAINKCIKLTHIQQR